MQISEIDYAPMAMDVWQPQRGKDVEMIVFGDGGGFVRLYEVCMNPAVCGMCSPAVMCPMKVITIFQASTMTLPG
jgi:hypothetical protein